MADIVEDVKQGNRIEDVLEATGVGLQRQHGRYLRSAEHDSLVVDTVRQCYHWNSRNEAGDVITWLEKRNRWDFKTAVEWLARRAGLPEPNWGKEEPEVRLAARAREDAWQVAQRVMAGWLLGDGEAMAYACGRGWTEETIRDAGLGFTGRAAAAEVQEMRGELSMNGVDLESPTAVCILGYRGDVRAWGAKWTVEVHENWIEWGFVPGLMGRKRLVYTHNIAGRVRYFTARNILGDEINKEGREVKSYNLPVALAGERQVFFNQAYAPRAESCVVVEGQADAITLGQWGIASVALAGTGWQDHAELIKDLRERHDVLYLGLDADEAGKKALVGADGDWPLAQVFGPLGRVLTWPKVTYGEGQAVKDANDWLKFMVREAIPPEKQGELVNDALAAAVPMAVAAAKWAGGRRNGAEQDRALQMVFRLIAQLPKFFADRYRETLCNALGLGIRDFNNMLKTARLELGQAGADDEDRAAEIVETLGGYFQGWLVDYLYDAETNTARLAYRDPEGKTGEADHLDIGASRYIPKKPSSLMVTKSIIFASAVGPLKTTRELVGMVEAFIHQHYLLDDKFFARLAAYYVLLTWVYDSFSAIPYLRAVGDYGSGKSQLMLRIGHVCYRMMATGGAGTAASLFRALHQFRGTAFMDEMDLQDGGDMANDLIKILNLGAMKNNPVWRTTETTNANGSKEFEVEGYDIYGPKLIAMRGDFKDQAVASRCLTVKLMGKEPLELKAAGVKLHLDDTFFKQAQALRNLLMRWRLEKWQPEIAVGEELMDLAVPARLNQVTMPLKAIAKGDPELTRDITTFIRALNDELILERGMGLDARVMEAVIAITEGSYKSYLMEGDCGQYGQQKYTLHKYLAKVTNEIIDQMNRTDDGTEEQEDEQSQQIRRKREVTSHKVGRITRDVLQLHSYRKNDGYAVLFDLPKIEALKVKYGLSRPETGNGEVNS